ncbi:hypothetical protein H4R19_003411, partial [Coemansia spiralis]
MLLFSSRGARRNANATAAAAAPPPLPPRKRSLGLAHTLPPVEPLLRDLLQTLEDVLQPPGGPPAPPSAAGSSVPPSRSNSSTTPPGAGSALPSRTSSLANRPSAAAAAAAAAADARPPLPVALSVDTRLKATEGSLDSGPYSKCSSPPLPLSNSDSASEAVLSARTLLDRERQREGKRKAALFELVDTERTYTDDLRMVVELFLLPIQLLGNRKIVEVIFGDMVKITEMNGKMYKDMITRLGPLACLVDEKSASRNRRKKRNALKTAATSHMSASTRFPLQGSSLRSPASPSAVPASASTTMSRRLSNSGDPHLSSPRASVYSYGEPVAAADASSLARAGSRHDDAMSIRT